MTTELFMDGPKNVQHLLECARARAAGDMTITRVSDIEWCETWESFNQKYM